MRFCLLFLLLALPLQTISRPSANTKQESRPNIESIATVAGNGKPGFSGDGGPATSASLNRPVGLAVDRAGNLYIAERDAHRIRKVTPAGVITTLAGTGVAGFSGDGGAAAGASLNMPHQVADRVS